MNGSLALYPIYPFSVVPFLMVIEGETFVFIPSLAVTTPTESTLVTSSYVNVPPTLTLPPT